MRLKEDAMHDRFGYGGGMCRDCPHFVAHLAGNRKLYKCRAYGISMSSATDWKPTAVACGLFHHSINGLTPVFQQMENERSARSNGPVEGQVDMFGNIVTKEDLKR